MSGEQSITGGLAGRYALAAFELAQDLPAPEQTQMHDNMAGLAIVLADNPDLQQLVRNPLISADDQTKTLTAVLEKAGAATLLKQFVAFIISKRRGFLLTAIVQAYLVLLAEARDEMTAYVSSAHALDAPQVQALAATLKQALGKTVHIEQSVNPALLGGLVLKVGSRMIDSSLATQLKSLQTTMNEAL